MSHTPFCSSTWLLRYRGHCRLGQQAGSQESISCHHAANARHSGPLEAAALTLEAKCRKAPAISNTEHPLQILAALIWVVSPVCCSAAATSGLAGSPPQLAGSVACREEDATALGLGSTRKAEDACAAHAPLAIAAWKGRGSLSVLVSKGMHLRSLMGKLLVCGSRGITFTSGL